LPCINSATNGTSQSTDKAGHHPGFSNNVHNNKYINWRVLSAESWISDLRQWFPTSRRNPATKGNIPDDWRPRLQPRKPQNSQLNELTADRDT